MADMVRVAVATKYDYVDLLDYLASVHLKDTIKDVCERYYADYDHSNKVKGKAYSIILGQDLINYVNSYYDTENNMVDYVADLISSMYETNGTLRTLFSSVINRMREDGISVEKIRKVQDHLRVIIVL